MNIKCETCGWSKPRAMEGELHKAVKAEAKLKGCEVTKTSNMIKVPCKKDALTDSEGVISDSSDSIVIKNFMNSQYYGAFVKI